MIAFAYEGLELVKKMVAYHINVILTRILTNSVFSDLLALRLHLKQQQTGRKESWCNLY